MAEYYITAKKRDTKSGKIEKFIVRLIFVEGSRRMAEAPVICSGAWIVEKILCGHKFFTATQVEGGWKRGQIVDFHLTALNIGRPTHGLDHLPEIK